MVSVCGKLSQLDRRVFLIEKYCFNILNSCERFGWNCIEKCAGGGRCDNLPYFQSDAVMLKNHSSLSSGVLQVVVFSQAATVGFSN